MDIFRLEIDSPRSHYADIAALHIQEIHHGILPIFGDKFLSKLYSHIAIAPKSCIYVAAVNSRIVGFLAGTADIRKCYVSVLLMGWFSLPFLALSSVFKVNILKGILTLLIYPFNSSTTTQHRIKDCEKIKCEILTVAVTPDFQRKGVGQKLIKSFEDDLERWKVRGYYRVATNIVEENSNGFYKKLGFIPCHEVKHSKLTLQIYVKPILDEMINPANEGQNYVS